MTLKKGGLASKETPLALGSFSSVLLFLSYFSDQRPVCHARPAIRAS
jgi:hypothetical protein